MLFDVKYYCKILLRFSICVKKLLNVVAVESNSVPSKCSESFCIGLNIVSQLRVLALAKTIAVNDGYQIVQLIVARES